MMSYLEVENLSCGYSRGFQLESVSLSLPKGTFAGIIGRNGSGKSTFFKGLAGDLPLADGTIRLNGENITKLSLKEKARKIAIVSQFTEQSPITVEEYVLMGRIPYRKSFQFSYTAEDIAIAAKYIGLMGIRHLKDKPMTELSGGERQMAVIACALAQQPLLLLLDEPTSHLDITYQLRIMNLLQKMNEEDGLTVVMIIHDLNLAAEYCSHLTLLKKGKVLKQGTPDEVLTYSNIEEAYDTIVIVKDNPVSGKPVISPVSERWIEQYKKEQKDQIMFHAKDFKRM